MKMIKESSSSKTWSMNHGTISQEPKIVSMVLCPSLAIASEGPVSADRQSADQPPKDVQRKHPPKRS
jgi:hypothetical protein